MLDAAALEKLGLHEGAMAHARLIKNAGWYNAKGEKIGWGDIGVEDVAKLKAGLPPDEPLFLLGEQDSYWAFVEHNTGVAQLNTVNEKEGHPGFLYVMERARFIFFESEIFTWQGCYDKDFGTHKDFGYRGECECMCIRQDDMREKLKRFGALVRPA